LGFRVTKIIIKIIIIIKTDPAIAPLAVAPAAAAPAAAAAAAPRSQGKRMAPAARLLSA
jgi:hypothetical protein